VTEYGIERRIAGLERKVRMLSIALTSLLASGACLFLVGARCAGSEEVINAGDVTVKRLFAEKIFVMDAPTDPSAPRHIGAIMAMEGESSSLMFFDPDGQPMVRVGYTPEIQGLSILDPKQNADAFVGRIEGSPVVAINGSGGQAAARLRKTPDGGAVDALDNAGNVRFSAGVIDGEAVIGVSDAEGKRVKVLP
jgi:hypothetical protein